MKKLLLSAYNIEFRCLVTVGRSFIYNKNRSGPKIEPWGTPVVIFSLSDYLNFYIVQIAVNQLSNFFYPC